MEGGERGGVTDEQIALLKLVYGADSEGGSDDGSRSPEH